MTEFIAEISSNHNQDWWRCEQAIDRAAKIGCDGVKFQLFKTDLMFAAETLDVVDQRGNTLRDRDAWELPLEWLPRIRERCDHRGLQFVCTPFYLEAVGLLSTNTRVDIMKIASYELLWTDLLRAVAETGLPVVLSTGMASLEEVVDAVRTLRTSGTEDLTVLQCVSQYPAYRGNYNLKVIQLLREFCRCKTGLSDHTVDPAVIYRAVHRWEATMVEFHMDIDGSGHDFKYGHCWLPYEIQPVISTIRRGFESDGNWLKQHEAAEDDERMWRRDPVDGLRPMTATRRAVSNGGSR